MEASPEANRPTPKSTPTAGPSAVVIAAWAPSMLSVPETPERLAAASSSIAMFTDPATRSDSPTSHRVARSSLPRVPG